MVRHACPYCGRYGDKPILFTRIKQRVFAYIWDNPGCTADDIQNDVLKRRTKSNVSIHLGHIRKCLEGTPYRMVRIIMGGDRRMGKPPYHYKIVHHRGGVQNIKGPENGTV